ncbi:MAG: hypothetical protein EPO35_11475 [Acidobacteria bacterium]|nr:MAG: hypothetical protein EPO35_11475 [Acidobacteriota bacterium]
MRRAFALAAVLTLISAWPLLTHLGTALPSDLGDPILETWILWWNAHHVPLTAAWWDAPMFVPLAGTFALSEALIAFMPLTTPLQWAGVGPIATHNIAFVLSGPMAFAAAFVLARRLTKRDDAALLAALAFGFSPYRIAQLSHMQVLWSCWMAFGLAALHSYIEASASAEASARKARWRALAAFGACWMLNGFTNGYFLAYYPVLVGLWLLWFARRWRDWLSVGATAAVASLPLVPMLIGYAQRQHAFGLSRQISEIRQFSADLSALWAASPRAWLSSHWTVAPGPEGELYPGLAMLALIAVGVFVAIRRPSRETSNVQTSSVQRSVRHAGRWTAGRWTVFALAITAAALALLVMLTGGSELHLGPLSLSVHRPSRLLTVAFWLGLGAFATGPIMRRAWASRSPLAFYVLAGITMYFFALGPEPRFGATQILYKPPYAWLLYLPGFDSVRVPARFGLLMILCLSQAAALAFMRMTPGVVSSENPRLQPLDAKGLTATVLWRKRLPVSFLALAILAEGWIVMPVAGLPEKLVIPERGRAAGTLVMELPIEMTYEANTLALLHQLDHRQPLINGFSGYLPAHYHALGVALKDGDATALDAIREVGPIAAFVDSARDVNGVESALVAAAPGAELLERTARGVWFLLPQQTRRPEPASAGAQLPVSAIDATNRPEGAEPEKLIDGRSNTRWHGQINGEIATDVVTLTLAKPAVVDVVEIDQGLWAGSYARDLEIVLVTDQGEVTAFRGATGGLSVRAALAMSANVAMRIPIAPAPPALAVKLISHPRGAKWTWSVGEVRLFGK